MSALPVRRLLTVLRTAALLAVVVFGVGDRLDAHEAGTTRVAISIGPDHTYDVAIVTDAASLVEKLRAVADGPAPSDLSAHALRQDILEALDDFHGRLVLTFDQVPVHPDTTVSADASGDSAAVPAATIHLTGRVPSGARTVAWRYGWTFTSYTLTLHRPSDTADISIAVDGALTTSSFDLEAPNAPRRFLAGLRQAVIAGFSHVLPAGVELVLLGLSFVVWSSRPRAVFLQVTAFVTALTIGTLAGLRINSGPIHLAELLTTAGVAVVAVDNLWPSRTALRRLVLVGLCGLLHSQTFAAQLRHSELPSFDSVATVAASSLGVEAALLAVGGVAFLLIGAGWSHQVWYRGRVTIPASALIACATVVWTLDRLRL